MNSEIGHAEVKIDKLERWGSFISKVGFPVVVTFMLLYAEFFVLRDIQSTLTRMEDILNQISNRRTTMLIIPKEKKQNVLENNIRFNNDSNRVSAGSY